MTATPTSDEFESFDTEFEEASRKIGLCLENQTPITDEIEEAADRQFDIAIQLGDRAMLMVCLAGFARFVEHNRTPPWAMLAQLHDAFRRFGIGDCDTIDAAFGLKQTQKGRPSRWPNRVIARFKAGLVESLVAPLGVNKARETIEELLDEPDLRRTHSKYRRIVKRK